MKRIGFLFLVLALSIGVFGCTKKPDIQIDYEAAEEEFTRELSENQTFYYSHTNFERYDITGDGYDDLYTVATGGSGMIRDDIFVYDPVNRQVYIVTSSDEDGIYSYRIEKAGKSGLVVARSSLLLSSDDEVVGKLEFVDDSIVFVED